VELKKKKKRRFTRGWAPEKEPGGGHRPTTGLVGGQPVRVEDRGGKGDRVPARGRPLGREAAQRGDLSKMAVGERRSKWLRETKKKLCRTELEPPGPKTCGLSQNLEERGGLTPPRKNYGQPKKGATSPLKRSTVEGQLKEPGGAGSPKQSVGSRSCAEGGRRDKRVTNVLRRLKLPRTSAGVTGTEKTDYEGPSW